MKYIEYGKDNKEVFLLLHGGGLSCWNYRKIADLLCDKYHIVLPILDGHSGSDKPFTSIEDNADEIIRYIDENFGGSIFLLGGLSLGAQIVVDVISKRSDIAKHLIIESPLLIPSKSTANLVKPSISMSYWLIAKKWFAKAQFKSLHINEEFFDEYYKDSCAISKENMISILKANSLYQPKESLKNCFIPTRIIVGGKEYKKMKKSAQILNDLLPNSVLEIKSKYYHGDYSINHPEEYVADLNKSVL